jgi:hypothetical protein
MTADRTAAADARDWNHARLMRPPDIVTRLTSFTKRAAGTDAERRAAGWLRGELASLGRGAELEPFWSRPNWAFAHAWHAALGVAGSLVSVSAPRVGGALVLVALLSVLADALTGVSLGRRLTLEGASQNVVSELASQDTDRVRLIVTANYDSGRTGLAYRDGPRQLAARLRRATGALSPGWIGWLTLALCWLLAVAILRVGGAHGTAIGAAQLPPTVLLVVALALLAEQASARPGPAAGDNASGVAVALALARELDAAPPRRLAVDIVLQGAGDGGGIGLRRYLRARRRTLPRASTIVLGIAACGAGRPRWWVSDGALFPLGYGRRLRELCTRVAGAEAHLGAVPHRGRGVAPAFPARLAGLPAVAIGCLDERGLAPRSHQPGDTPDEVDDASISATLEFALALVDAIDADLETRGAAG